MQVITQYINRYTDRSYEYSDGKLVGYTVGTYINKTLTASSEVKYEYVYGDYEADATK